MGVLATDSSRHSTWDGGFRMPAMAWFPGRIPAGSTSDAIVSTMDIHPTLAALAGVEPPTDRIIDGLDMSPVIFKNQSSSHSCYFFYLFAVASDAKNGLAAVRCGDYKAYYTVKSTRKQPWSGKFDPPLMFNVFSDPGETLRIAEDSAEYKAA